MSRKLAGLLLLRLKRRQHGRKLTGQRSLRSNIIFLLRLNEMSTLLGNSSVCHIVIVRHDFEVSAFIECLLSLSQVHCFSDCVPLRFSLSCVSHCLRVSPVFSFERLPFLFHLFFSEHLLSLFKRARSYACWRFFRGLFYPLLHQKTQLAGRLERNYLLDRTGNSLQILRNYEFRALTAFERV